MLASPVRKEQTDAKSLPHSKPLCTHKTLMVKTKACLEYRERTHTTLHCTPSHRAHCTTSLSTPHPEPFLPKDLSCRTSSVLRHGTVIVSVISRHIRRMLTVTERLVCVLKAGIVRHLQDHASLSSGGGSGPYSRELIRL